MRRTTLVLSQKRVATLPGVPTTREAGFPEFQMSIWYGMFAPAGTPREIVQRLYAETAKAFNDGALKQHMSAAGMDPWLGTPEDMANLLRTEMTRYRKIIQAAGIKAE